MPGVTIEDMGYKMGLNGVDNAKLSFDNVRVPREALLNRWSDVAEVRHNRDSALLITAKALKGQQREMCLCLMCPINGAQ